MKVFKKAKSFVAIVFLLQSIGTLYAGSVTDKQVQAASLQCLGGKCDNLAGLCTSASGSMDACLGLGKICGKLGSKSAACSAL